jgi:hypothetical protein
MHAAERAPWLVSSRVDIGYYASAEGRHGASRRPAGVRVTTAVCPCTRDRGKCALCYGLAYSRLR